MFGKLLTLIFALLAVVSSQYYGGYPVASGGYYGNSIYGGAAYGGYPGYGYQNGGYYGGFEYGSPYGYVGKRSSGFGPNQL